MADIDSGVFRNVLGHFPTGVTAVTAVNEGKHIGLASGAFTSGAPEPPLVAFLPGKESGSWNEIREAGFFCVNVMGHDQLEVCGVMASRAEDKFADVDWSPASSGSPIIAGSVAYIDCEIEAVHDGGDHDIVIGRVLGLEVMDSKSPLVFFQGSYGTFS